MELSEQLLVQLQEAFISGKGFKELCLENNLNISSVLKRAKLENWAKPKPQLKKTKVIQKDKRDLLQRGHDYAHRMANILEETLSFIEDQEPENRIGLIDEIEKLDKVARRSFGLDSEVKGGPTLNVNILSQGIAAFTQVQAPELLPNNKQLQIANQ